MSEFGFRNLFITPVSEL